MAWDISIILLGAPAMCCRTRDRMASEFMSKDGDATEIAVQICSVV